MKSVVSFWGHHGLFDGMGPDGPPPMPPLDVTRAPVQVMEGNYHRMSGVCPWWDAMRARLVELRETRRAAPHPAPHRTAPHTAPHARPAAAPPPPMQEDRAIGNYEEISNPSAPTASTAPIISKARATSFSRYGFVITASPSNMESLASVPFPVEYIMPGPGVVLRKYAPNSVPRSPSARRISMTAKLGG